MLQEHTRSSEHLISHQRLNMELDLQSELLCTIVLIGLRVRDAPPPRISGLIYEDAVGQPR